MISLKFLLPYKTDNAIEISYKGVLKRSQDFSYTCYFTEHSTKYMPKEEDNSNTVYGSCSQHQRIKRLRSTTGNFIQWTANFDTIKLFVDSQEVKLSNSLVILYDLDEVKESQTLFHGLDHNNLDDIRVLQQLVQTQNHGDEATGKLCSLPAMPSWIHFSMFLQHLYCYNSLWRWLLNDVKRNRKFRIKQVNFVLAVLNDLLLGYACLQLLSLAGVQYSSFLMGLLEDLVNNLNFLLKWLMGAPAGLKLNNAFNKLLGKYFSYHIQLWWIFLEVSGEKLDIILKMFQYVGYLGLTFQAVLISDLFCISIFHSYCIYVYAARLFNLQISGLMALMRLFLGRKRNPLRKSIDSCEYTNQELFVGTVAFTILLLLLPTTAMYYTVFTLLRLVSLGVQHCFAKLIYHVQTFPLYISLLWITRSPKVRGNVYMETISDHNSSGLVLRIKLQTKPLKELNEIFLLPVTKPKSVDISNLVCNLLNGNQII